MPSKRTVITRVQRQPGTRTRPGEKTRWLVCCDVCGDAGFLGMSIRPLRYSTDWLLAVRWARQHARRHTEQACPTCHHMAPIEDTSKQVEDAA